MECVMTQTTNTTGAWVAGSEGLEKTRLNLGFIPLTDCAPLVVGVEKGFFARHGLDVRLSREASWANIRDKVSIGALDGAHMLAGMPISGTLGIDPLRQPVLTAFTMDLNGNAITVSRTLYDRMLAADPAAMAERPMTARALKAVIELDRRTGREPMQFATVFPVSTHNYELRYWMAAAGIDPDRDVRLTVIPPPQMAANLQTGKIDGYCVGEPWNAFAVTKGFGCTLITSYEIWNNRTEKVFGVTTRWAERHPNTHKALIRALIEAAQWLDQTDNRLEAARLLADPLYVAAPEAVIRLSMTGSIPFVEGEPARELTDFIVFNRYAANFPWQSHAAWFITQMMRWGQVAPTTNISGTAAAVFRSDIYRDAARELGIPVPTVDTKIEGSHDTAWTLTQATQPIAMGPDRFFDGRIFDPADPIAYIGACNRCDRR
jgi:ABC-type nitrate/sulfonate/bicarbonate transport system substrate-binding protein